MAKIKPMFECIPQHHSGKTSQLTGARRIPASAWGRDLQFGYWRSQLNDELLYYLAA